jgi:hypothetical protein
MGSNDPHMAPPRNRGGRADCARDQDERELRGGDVCGGGRSPFRAEPAAEQFGHKTAGCEFLAIHRIKQP